MTTFRETLPEPLLALLWGQLVERLGLLLPQKGFVVVVKVVAVVVVPVTEKLIVMNPVLLLRGLAGGVHHTEGKAHHKGPQLHLLYPQEQGGTGYLVIVVSFLFFFGHCTTRSSSLRWKLSCTSSGIYALHIRVYSIIITIIIQIKRIWSG